jgi:hypothetical protein
VNAKGLNDVETLSSNSSTSISQRPRPFQFSLANLIIVAVMCCAVAGYIGERLYVRNLQARLVAEKQNTREAKLEADRLQRELGIARNRLGKLTVSDPNAIYVMALSTTEDYVWKWKVYLPRHKRWRIATRQATFRRKGKVNDVSPEGVIDFDAVKSIEGGEFTIEAYVSRSVRSFIVRVGDKIAQLPISPDHEKSISEGPYGSTTMSNGSAYLVDKNDPTRDGAPSPMAFDAGKQLVLFEWQHLTDSSQRRGWGIQVWIEPDEGNPEFFAGPAFDVSDYPAIEPENSSILK